jgi:hypothetical protein
LRPLTAFFAAALVLAGPAIAQPIAQEKPFLDQNQQAMTRMMQDMAVPPTGDVDHDFVAMMAAHHQGAIDMAVLLLRYSKNENLKRLAQEIIVTQQQEIAAMRLAVGEPLPPSTPSPTGLSHTAPKPMNMPMSETQQ